VGWEHKAEAIAEMLEHSVDLNGFLKAEGSTPGTGIMEVKKNLKSNCLGKTDDPQ
jgi:hypothetical protein